MEQGQKIWWYATGQEKAGPCSSAELRRLVAEGKLFPDNLVWKEGLAEWVPASRIKGLWGDLPATPPPPPAFATPAPAPALLADDPAPSPRPSSRRDLRRRPEMEEPEDYLDQEDMNFKAAVTRCFKKYADFSGRASRAEYWYFILFQLVLGLGIGVIASLIGMSDSSLTTLASLLQLGLFLPSLAAAVRRLHDTNKNGWWILIVLVPFVGPFLLLYWAVKAGDDGENDFGYPM